MLIGATALLAIAAIVGIVSLVGSDDPGTGGGRPRRRFRRAAAAPLGIASNWRRRAALPTPRQNMDGTVVDGTIWVAGGLGKGSLASDRVEGYDPVINGWKSAPDLPARLHHEMAVNYKDELVVLGGWIPQGSDQSALVSDQVYALRNGEWVRLPALRTPRAAGAAAVVGDKIVVVGGQDDSHLVRTTDVFDGKQMDRGQADADAARAPRRGFGRQVPLCGGRAQPRPRQELRCGRAL